MLSRLAVWAPSSVVRFRPTHLIAVMSELSVMPTVTDVHVLPTRTGRSMFSRELPHAAESSRINSRSPAAVVVPYLTQSLTESMLLRSTVADRSAYAARPVVKPLAMARSELAVPSFLSVVSAVAVTLADCVHAESPVDSTLFATPLETIEPLSSIELRAPVSPA